MVDTDKADIDAEIFDEGVIGEILVAAGEKVPVGTLLATIVDERQPIAATAAPAPSEERQPAPMTAVPATPTPTVVAHGPVLLSPVVRRLAERNGVDQRSLRGTGPGGRITRADVEAAIRDRTTRRRVLSRAPGVSRRPGESTSRICGERAPTAP